MQPVMEHRAYSAPLPRTAAMRGSGFNAALVPVLQRPRTVRILDRASSRIRTAQQAVRRRVRVPSRCWIHRVHAARVRPLSTWTCPSTEERELRDDVSRVGWRSIRRASAEPLGELQRCDCVISMRPAGRIRADIVRAPSRALFAIRLSVEHQESTTTTAMSATAMAVSNPARAPSWIRMNKSYTPSRGCLGESVFRGVRYAARGCGPRTLTRDPTVRGLGACRAARSVGHRLVGYNRVYAQGAGHVPATIAVVIDR